MLPTLYFFLALSINITAFAHFLLPYSYHFVAILAYVTSPESLIVTGIKSPFDKTDEFKTGIFFYNENEDDWDDWEEYFKRMTDKNEQMMKLLNW